MSLPSYVFDEIAQDAELLALEIGAGEVRRSGRPADVPPGQRFVMLSWGGEGPFAGTDTQVRPFELRVWAYDREPSYARIGEILDRIRVILMGLVSDLHTSSPEGWITSVEWLGRSADLSDDVYNAVARYDTYRIIAS